MSAVTRCATILPQHGAVIFRAEGRRIFVAMLLLCVSGGCGRGRGSVPEADGPAAAIHAVRPRASYAVGVDYHSYGGDFAHTAFIKIYDQPEVRATVQAQLQGMADRGATVMSTRLWLVTEPGTTDFGESWRLTFPMTDLEAQNLRAYAQDVAAVQAADGHRLRLDLCLLWLGSAEYQRGSPATGLGYYQISASEFITRVSATTDKMLAAVSDVRRPDGARVVGTVYLDAIMIGDASPNTDWFMANNYPRFVAQATAAGVTPSVYFNVTDSTDGFLQDDFVDPDFAILNGHRSMYWAYRTLKWMVDHDMPVPPRIDFGFYINDPAGADYARIFSRVLNDADAVLPSLGASRSYGIPETHYFGDSAQRKQFGQAFANHSTDPRFQMVAFWTTPWIDAAGTTGGGFAYPFAIEDYLPVAPR